MYILCPSELPQAGEPHDMNYMKHNLNHSQTAEFILFVRKTDFFLQSNFLPISD
jgi:hypothetical protein